MNGDRLLQLGTELVQGAASAGLTLRMCEGIAILAQCPSIATHPSLQRSYLDLDLFAAADAWGAVPGFLARQGLVQRTETPRALTFEREGAVIEVLHPSYQRGGYSFAVAERLKLTPLTLPLADLMLLKLARNDFEEKDLQDCAALLVDHRVTDGGDEAEDINRSYLYRIVNNNYGMWKVVFDNTVTLEKSFDKYLEPEEAQLAWRRTERLQEVLDGKSHSISWWAGKLVNG
jgi:hypothetical protein